MNLAELGVFGLHGPLPEVQAMCASVLLQAATLHSPEDLVIVVLEGHAQGLGTWVKWLPHTRSVNSPLAGPHVVDDECVAAEMIRELVSVARMRTARRPRRPPLAVDPRRPRRVGQRRSGARVAAARAVPAGRDLGGRRRRVRRPGAPPGQGDLPVRSPRRRHLVDGLVHGAAGAGRGVRARAGQRPADRPGGHVAGAAPRRHLGERRVGDPARRPAAVVVRPRTADPAVGRGDLVDPEAVRVARPDRHGPVGPLELDLVEHGPHALIGGTSGAGKSELLQSIVAALIHEYPPTRLTFLFVDYKGGAASVVFNTVPHTVGYVTNLDSSLSLRALTSLRAELNHRMRLMEGKAKDLAEMLERFPDEAPPSLVIVVDEFATLVKEVPDFVAGVVDIAQRGRSLGVHLILATQRPSGSVNDNILANTNLRISLRMLDASESKTVIGVALGRRHPAAAEGSRLRQARPARPDRVPVGVHRRGAHPGARGQPRRRAPLRQRPPGRRQHDDGRSTDDDERPGRSPPERRSRRRRGATHRASMPAQWSTPSSPFRPPSVGVSYQGITYQPTIDESGMLAPPIGLPMPPPTLAPPIAATPDRRRPPHRPGRTTTTAPTVTHLDVLLEAVRGAMPSLPPPRKPWREMLPEQLTGPTIERPEYTSAGGRKGRFITLGMLDDPAAQAQYPAVFDLEEAGGLLIGGSGGSGKTTALRTAAMSAVSGATPDEVALFVIDCASRSLVTLRDLPTSRRSPRATTSSRSPG